MQPKTTWMRCLLFGTSLVLTASHCADVDYQVKADFIYINEITHSIELISINGFSLSPNSAYTIKTEGDGGKNTTSDSFVPPFLDGIVVYNGIKCDTLSSGTMAGQGEGPAVIQNYESVKLRENHFEFTYRFTEAPYSAAVDCN